MTLIPGNDVQGGKVKDASELTTGKVYVGERAGQERLCQAEDGVC